MALIMPSNALRFRAHALRGGCAAALAELDGSPAAILKIRPEIQADRFVCCVARKDWAAAEAALALVPSQLLGRGDVVSAQEKLSAERLRNGKGRTGGAGPARVGAPESSRP